MDEFAFIQSIRPVHLHQESLIQGIDDDAAVFRPGNRDVVTTVDTLVDGVHFSKDTMEPYHIGYRALAANLSDLAAMGSVPAFYLVSLVVPIGYSHEELKGIYEGMKELAEAYQVDLIGGDTVSGKELSISITVMGYVKIGGARYRSHAQAGDRIFVTGTLGDSRGGLELLLNQMDSSSEAAAYLIQRHRQPSPRVRFAASIHDIDRIALNDVSDGIANEANEIAAASQVDLHIENNLLPCSSALAALFPNDSQEWMLSGGEDFELLGTVAEENWQEVQAAADQLHLPIHIVGRVEEKAKEAGQVILHKNGEAAVLEKSGYTHLKGGE